MRKHILVFLFVVYLSGSVLTGCNYVDTKLLNEQVEAAMERASEAGNEALKNAAEEKLQSITAKDLYEANKMSNILKHKDSCKIQILYDSIDNSDMLMYNTDGCYYIEYAGNGELTEGHSVYGYTEENDDGDIEYCSGYLVGAYYDEMVKDIDENQMFELDTLFDDIISEIRDIGDSTIEIITDTPQDIVKAELEDEYTDGDYGKCIYTCEKDTLIFKNIVSTLYDKDDGVLYECTVKITFDEDVPEGMKRLTDRLSDSDDVRTLTVIFKPDTDMEETFTVKAKIGEPVSQYSWEDYYGYSDRACTVPVEELDYTKDYTLYLVPSD